MAKKTLAPFRPVYPSPAALITSVDKDGSVNIITLGEVFNISIQKPVIVGIAIRPATYSHALISKSHEFVVNLPTSAMLRQVDGCGRISGRDGVNKSEMFGLTAVPAEKVNAPLIAECPVNIECKVINSLTVGDHDLFFGEVVAVHADDDKLDENGSLATEKLDMLIYAAGQYWSAGKRLENHGFSKNK